MVLTFMKHPQNSKIHTERDAPSEPEKDCLVVGEPETGNLSSGGPVGTSALGRGHPGLPTGELPTVRSESTPASAGERRQ